MKISEALREDFWEYAELLKTSEGRRALTEHDPLLFAYVYFPHHIKNPSDGSMTVCDFHLDLLDYASTWSKPVGKAKEHRACFIAPRSSGKSTWIFLLLPIWAAAHGHRKFVAAFSDSETQAITHLQTFKMELSNNDLLRQDFPELCAGMKMNGSAKDMLNNRNQIMQSNGFIFMAKGADSASLGMKLGALRPDVLLFDDIEPGESNYSDHEARKRKETLVADLFALNNWAVVAIVGTTTMPNSLIDQMRKVEAAEKDWLEDNAQRLDETPDAEPVPFREAVDPDLRWVLDENIKVHYWPVILDEHTENERSLWPEKFTWEEIERDRGTRAFAKNMMNKPVSADGGFWDEDDIEIDRPQYFKNVLVSVDPAVTTAVRSDYTGIAVLAMGSDNCVYVLLAEQLKVDTETLAARVKGLVSEFNAGILLVETNQGGDIWKTVFKDVPCRYRSIRQRTTKEARALEVVDHYKRKQVKHVKHFHVAEEQMLAFPHVAHDDVVDAIVTGVLAFKKYARKGVSARQSNYMEV